MENINRTTQIYYGVALGGLVYLIGICWTQPLRVIFRGGLSTPVVPGVTAGVALLVGAILVGWALFMEHPPRWVRMVATTLGGGVWLQLGRYLVGVDTPTLVGWRGCWIVRESTLVERSNLVNSAYINELTRLFGGLPPEGVSLTPPPPGVDTLLWGGDLATLGVTQALHEHITWIVRTASVPPPPSLTPPPPGWADWLVQWGPTLVVGGLVVAVTVGVAVWWYGGLPEEITPDIVTPEVVEELATDLNTLASKMVKLDGAVMASVEEMKDKFTILGNRNGIILHKVNRLAYTLISIAGLNPATVNIFEITSTELASRIQANAIVNALRYAKARSNPPSEEETPPSEEDEPS